MGKFSAFYSGTKSELKWSYRRLIAYTFSSYKSTSTALLSLFSGYLHRKNALSYLLTFFFVYLMLPLFLNYLCLNVLFCGRCL